MITRRGIAIPAALLLALWVTAAHAAPDSGPVNRGQAAAIDAPPPSIARPPEVEPVIEVDVPPPMIARPPDTDAAVPSDAATDQQSLASDANVQDASAGIAADSGEGGAVAPAAVPRDTAGDAQAKTDAGTDAAKAAEPPVPPVVLWFQSLSPSKIKQWFVSEQGMQAILRLLLGVAILVVGWLLTHLISAGIYRGAVRITSDARLAQLVGFSIPPAAPTDPKRSPERLVARATYVLLMLVVLLAVLHFGGFRQMSTSLDRFARALAYALPLIGRALIILGVCYVVARLLSHGVVRGLRGLALDERLARLQAAVKSRSGAAPDAPMESEELTEMGYPEPRSISEQAGQVTFWLVLAFGLAASIESLEFLPLSQPIRDAIESVIAFLPSLGAAILIVLGGYLLARLARHVVQNLLESMGFDAMVQRLDLGRAMKGRRASAVGGVVAMVVVLAQAAIAALNQAGLTTLSNPLTAMVTQVWRALPRVVVGIVILLVGLLLSRVARNWAEGGLRSFGFDELMARIGIERLRTATPTHVAGGFVRLLVLLLAAQQAFIAMGLLTWGEHVGTFLSFIFSNVLLSALIVIAGFAVGTYVRELIINRQLTDPESTRWMAALARAAILVFAFTMAIEHLGIAERFVTLAFAFVFGALCLALALALGLGGQKLAQDLLQRRFGGISKLPEVPKLAAPKAEAHSQSMAPDRKPR